MILKTLIGVLLYAWVAEAQLSCQDIDTQACQLMHIQKPGLCTDPSISATACPRYCKQCALTCYDCSFDINSPEDCNTTTTCSLGESCLTKTLNLTSDGIEMFTMTCGRPEECDGPVTEMIGKRDTQSNSCCTDDLCNGPYSMTTVTMPTSMATTTVTMAPVAMTTTAKYGCARDVIFIVDESASMALVFSNVKQFIADLVSKLTIGSSDTLVSMATFAHQARDRWDLNKYTDKQQLMNAIQGLTPNLAINSDGLVGLNYVIHHAVKNRFGHRPSVPDDVIFISDGSWHSNFLSFLTGKDDQHDVVAELHRDSNNVISIGIGPANSNMIHNVATDTAHTFKVQRAIDLISIETQVLDLICH